METEKLYSRNTIPSKRLYIQSQQYQRYKKMGNKFNVNNKHNRINVINVAFLSLLLTLNRFQSFFLCFFCASLIFTITPQARRKRGKEGGGRELQPHSVVFEKLQIY